MANEKVDILLLGSGGREHALLVKLAESPRAGRLYVAPGNGGMNGLAEAVSLDENSPTEVAAWARDHGIGLVVIGPEAPLVAGVADAVRSAGIPCFGPNGNAAQMEGSKKFAKQVMSRAGVPTAAYRSFTDEEPCLEYVERVGAPIAREAYEDHSPEPVPQLAAAPPRRERGTGRPTKRERRQFERLRGRDQHPWSEDER